MYESSSKETKWVCIQLACSWRPRALEEAHCWNIQAKFYNEKFPLVYESDNIWVSLWKTWCYFEAQYMRLAIWRIWCYFEAQVWKKGIVGLPLFIYFLFSGPSFFFLWPFFWDNALLNDDHHTSIYLQLNDYNSILEQSMTLYECLRRCTGIAMNQERYVWKIMNGGFATNTMSTTWSC